MFASALLATSASATEIYSADYYDDGENLHLIAGWEDPYATPDPEADFYAPVNMPLHHSGGGCCGSGQTNGMEPVSDANHTSEVEQLAEASAFDMDKAPESMSTTSSVPCPRRRCPTVMSTGRRINASGIIRVVFQQDNGDGFSMFARRAREEPPEFNYEVDDDDYDCAYLAEDRGRQARRLAVISGGGAAANLPGRTFRFTHGGGVDVFINIAHLTSPCMMSTTCPSGDQPPLNGCPGTGG